MLLKKVHRVHAMRRIVLMDSFSLLTSEAYILASTRGPMGHILDTGIRCFRAIRVGISTAAQ